VTSIRCRPKLPLPEVGRAPRLSLSAKRPARHTTATRLRIARKGCGPDSAPIGLAHQRTARNSAHGVGETCLFLLWKTPSSRARIPSPMLAPRRIPCPRCPSQDGPALRKLRGLHSVAMAQLLCNGGIEAPTVRLPCGFGAGRRVHDGVARAPEKWPGPGGIARVLGEWLWTPLSIRNSATNCVERAEALFKFPAGFRPTLRAKSRTMPA